jgi:hypothetical protein
MIIWLIPMLVTFLLLSSIGRRAGDPMCEWNIIDWGIYITASIIFPAGVLIILGSILDDIKSGLCKFGVFLTTEREIEWKD